MSAGGGPSLALAALLDGIPEQFVLGTGLAAGGSIGIGLLVAIFVSNLPEAIGSASEIRAGGVDRGTLIGLRAAISVVCMLSTVVGYQVAQTASDSLTAAADGFAAGTLLVMLVDAMVPEALHTAGCVAGLVATIGFTVAAYLTTVS